MSVAENFWGLESRKMVAAGKLFFERYLELLTIQNGDPISYVVVAHAYIRIVQTPKLRAA